MLPDNHSCLFVLSSCVDFVLACGTMPRYEMPLISTWLRGLEQKHPGLGNLAIIVATHELTSDQQSAGSTNGSFITVDAETTSSTASQSAP
jgi:hypothetical protein